MNRVIDTKRITTKKILKITGHNSKSLFAMWRTGERFITTGDAVKLANYLGVTIDDLLNHDLKELESQFDTLKKLFLQYYSLLTDDDKDTIRFIIEKRVKENEKKD